MMEELISQMQSAAAVSYAGSYRSTC